MKMANGITAVYLKLLDKEHEQLWVLKKKTGLNWEDYILTLAGLKKRGEK